MPKPAYARPTLAPRSAATQWAVVPSLPAKPWAHPLRGPVAGRVKGSEAPLAAPSVSQPRTVNPDHFTCNVRMSPESHVLLIDDLGQTPNALLAEIRGLAATISDTRSTERPGDRVT